MYARAHSVRCRLYHSNQTLLLTAAVGMKPRGHALKRRFYCGRVMRKIIVHTNAATLTAQLHASLNAAEIV